jgi:hypothetical protein
MATIRDELTTTTPHEELLELHRLFDSVFDAFAAGLKTIVPKAERANELFSGELAASNDWDTANEESDFNAMQASFVALCDVLRSFCPGSELP